jgi:hypothetical protein
MNTMNKYMEQFRKQFNDQFKDVQPFSGETALLLGLFSWFVYLLIRDMAARELVAWTGWFFIIVGTDWVLFKKTFKIPLLELPILYGPWITGALLSAALYSNRWFITDLPTALIVWPLLSAIIAAIPTLLKTGPQFKKFEDFQLFERQYLVNLWLIGILLSCWIQFHFLLDNLLQQYPSLLADTNMQKSAFVVQVNQPPISKGVVILETAVAMIREELRQSQLRRNLSWADGQRLLLNIQSETSPIRPLNMAPKIAQAVFGADEQIKESPLWFYNAQFYPSNIDNAPGSQSPWYGTLVLQAIWRGPSSQPNGYTLEQSCRVPREPPVPQVRGLEKPRDQSFYLLDCEGIKSRERGIVVERNAPPPRPTEDTWWRRLERTLLRRST